MTRKILVTGATGFIGQHLTRELLAHGESVRILTRGRSVGGTVDERVEIVIGDITDKETLWPATEDVDCIYHLAGEIRERESFLRVNVEGTRNMLEACLDSQISKFVHVSSAGVVSSVKNSVINEKAPCNPMNEYEKSKYEGEKIALDFFKKYGMPVVILRPTIAFGEGQRRGPDSFAHWLRAIQSGRFRFIGRGNYMANYVYVGDVVAACIRLAESEGTSGQVYIVSDPCPLREFVGAIAEILGVALSQRHIPIWLACLAALGLQAAGKVLGFSPPLTLSRVKALTNPTLYSSHKIEHELEFKPPVGYREGLRRTIRWYQERGVLSH